MKMRKLSGVASSKQQQENQENASPVKRMMNGENSEN